MSSLLSSESEMIRQLREGNENAFEHIFKKHFTGLCLFAEHFLKDTHAAENIVEDLFCDLWANARTISINVSLQGYLYKSVFNRCLKFLRHKGIEHKYLLDHQSFLNTDDNNDALKSDPLINLISKELEERISQAIQKLPFQCRKIFMLHRFQNLSYPEIAVELSCSVNTVKTQMSRALEKLRTELSDYLTVAITVFLLCNN